jgi:hypothetical protein
LSRRANPLVVHDENFGFHVLLLRTGFHKPLKNRPMFARVSVQPFRMKLHAQQKRHSAAPPSGFNSIASTIPSRVAPPWPH